MAFIDYETCEPLRIWGRLEPRTRDVDFDEALAARVHDPLWMLSRQWQIGEFQGEDTGSAVLAKLARRITPVGQHEIGPSGGVETENGALPAEARIERLPIDFAPITRAQIGRTFLLLLEEVAAVASPAPTLPLDPLVYRAILRTAFGILPDAEPDGDDLVARARARVGARARRTTAALAGRAVDGVRLYEALRISRPGLPGELAPAAQEHVPILEAAAARFRAWFEELYPAPPTTGDGWDAAQLEYRSACTLPTQDGDVRLSLTEHATGHLDWWSYDQDASVPGQPGSTTDVRSVIPAPASFAGMPNPRWWQFEDSAVDLGHFRAHATDLARIVVAEFTLVYGNNWFVVPYRQPVGTLAEIEGIVVTDVFGQRTLVEPAVGASTGSWSSWDLFSLSPRSSADATALGQHLFLPSTLGHVIEAEPHETVTLVRDESANMVWGVERRIADGLGGGQDGVESARRFTATLQALVDEREQAALDAAAALAVVPAAGAAPAPTTPVATPALRYRLGTEVSESWIPFVPVHVGTGSRAIQLQRAAMPRITDPAAGPQRIRPRTSILRQGLTDDDAPNPPPYYLHEEEVPRTGVTVSGALRRTRWIDGRTVIWHGRTASTGRGEVDSGLRFDVVEPVELG
jgi:hypothetical protein